MIFDHLLGSNILTTEENAQHTSETLRSAHGYCRTVLMPRIRLLEAVLQYKTLVDSVRYGVVY